MNDIQKYSNTEKIYVAQFGGELIKVIQANVAAYADKLESQSKFKLHPHVVEHNIKQGRIYVDGWGYLVGVQRLLDAGFHWTNLNREYTTK